MQEAQGNKINGDFEFSLKTAQGDLTVKGAGVTDGRLNARGGYGRVYFGERNGKKVAVKVMEFNSTTKGAVEREVSNFSGIKGGPHVMGAHEVVHIMDDEGNPAYVCIEMDCMNGGNLFEKCKNSDFTFKEKISILGQVAKGMASIHEQGFVHLDIKGDNIFLDDQGAKIGDFGFCRKTSDINYDLREGTVDFMAPEIKKRPSEIAGIKNEKISEADKEKKLNNLQKAGPPADIYSFGVMMLETLVDPEVFESRSLEDVIDGLPSFGGSDGLFNHLEKEIRDNLVYIVKGCLRVNMEARMDDDELGKELEALEQKMSKSA